MSTVPSGETAACAKHPDVPSVGTIRGKRNTRVKVCQRCAETAALTDQNYSYAPHVNVCDPDCSRSGVDQTDLGDPDKVWRCDGCGAVGTRAELDDPTRHFGSTPEGAENGS